MKMFLEFNKISKDTEDTDWKLFLNLFSLCVGALLHVVFK